MRTHPCEQPPLPQAMAWKACGLASVDSWVRTALCLLHLPRVACLRAHGVLGGATASCGVSTVQLWDSTASDSRRGAVRTFSTCGAGAGNVHTGRALAVLFTTRGGILTKPVPLRAGFGATDCRLVGDDERFVVVASATGPVLRLDTRAGGSTTTVPHLRRSTVAWDVLHTPHDDDARRVRGCKLIGESHAMCVAARMRWQRAVTASAP